MAADCTGSIFNVLQRIIKAQAGSDKPNTNKKKPALDLQARDLCQELQCDMLLNVRREICGEDKHEEPVKWKVEISLAKVRC